VRRVTDDRDLEGLDPYDLMDNEVARLERYFDSLSGAAWDVPSRCEGWSVRHVLAHLTSSEDYNRACLDGNVQQLMEQWGAQGATDLDGVNELGVRAWDDSEPNEILAVWRERIGANRRDFRARDGGDVDSSVGPYPARWQAFHLAFELAVHADDVFVPVEAGEEPARTAWQARFGRFAISELKPDATIERGDGVTRVTGPVVDIELADPEFVAVVSGRAGDSGLDAAVLDYVRAT
jgi:uncharacterized protein (TIGR03083 family)